MATDMALLTLPPGFRQSTLLDAGVHPTEDLRQLAAEPVQRAWLQRVTTLRERSDIDRELARREAMRRRIFA